MPQIVSKKSILDMAMGAIAEVTDYETNRVIANIMDPNTAATAKRKIVLTLTFEPDDYRQQVGMSVQAKTTLEVEQPCSDFLLRVGKNGEVTLRDADGGAWKLEAKRNIAAYLGEKLADLIESGNVVVMI